MSQNEVEVKTQKEKQKNKCIKDIFSDYETKSNIKDAEIKGLNFVKKKSELGIIIKSKEYIEIKEIWYFEKFLIERFKFTSINFKIEYEKNTKKKSIETEWRNIICYMAHKYPLAKPLLLMKSDIKIIENRILVKMHIKGADFLRAKKTDKELERVLKNLYGIEYKVELEEDIEEKEILEYEEKVRDIEEKAIENIIHAHKEENYTNINSKNANIGSSNNHENKMTYNHESKMTNNHENKIGNIQEFNDPDYKMPENLEGYVEENPNYIPEEMNQEGINQEEINQENLNQQEEIKQEYIMGKPTKAKEKKEKIKDITANDGRITLEGRILTQEARETKTGKRNVNI